MMQVMQAVLLLPALLAFSIASKHLDQEWETWKSKYGKKYITDDDEAFRRSAWEATWHKVRDHNLLAGRGNKSYRLEMNHFADMTTHERNSRGCLKVPRSAEKPMEVQNYRPAIDLPEEVDWRKENCVTKPKNQGSYCGSCWAFATVGVIESRYCIKHKKLLDLSEQQLVDCDSRNEGCCGGFPSTALEYVSENGIMKRENYEYVERAKMCAYKQKETIKMNISKFYVLPEESNIAAAVAFEGPVTVGFAVSEDFQLFNGDGIYDGDCAEEANHAIIIVGYGTEDNGDYWIIKNSWGTEWADNGYAKVRRNSNQCEIAGMAATADIMGPLKEK
ncbi:cathepsin S-like isoform X1 [Pleurodeles waltl]|uniref:cathepsin S-like isoform X1 n=1 Tax=Pleurodeles waltl TaxID=8319 RepID=UPI0037099B89